MQATVSRSEPVHLLTSTGKPSGCTIDGFRLVRRASGSVHQLRRPPAWSFERGILETAHEHGVKLGGGGGHGNRHRLHHAFWRTSGVGAYVSAEASVSKSRCLCASGVVKTLASWSSF